MIEVLESPKSEEQLMQDRLIRLALERAAMKIERQAGNLLYQKAWKVAAKIVRGMKPD